MQHAGEASSAPGITRAGSGGTVAINGLLQLYPPHLEAEVWQSPAAVRWVMEVLVAPCLESSTTPSLLAALAVFACVLFGTGILM